MIYMIYNIYIYIYIYIFSQKNLNLVVRKAHLNENNTRKA